ncbi:MAG: DUF3106 domain-containing protein [Phycisphaerae bacterium]
MDPRRAQLARLLRRRRRRVRLLLVCVVTAVACGTVAGLVGPRILIGGTGVGVAAVPSADAPVAADAAATPLDLPARLALDPRETQANAIRWQKMSGPRRRRLLDRYWDLAGLDAGEREALIDRYAAFRNLPEARRAFLRDRAAKLKAFVASLSPQDQAVLEGMDDEARARRLLDLWKARYGPW